MRSFTKLGVIAALGLSTVSGAAFAGSLQDATVEPPVIAPAPAPVFAGGDWTGPYVGLSFGNTDVTTSAAGAEGDNGTYGIHAGYDYDFGRFVVGGELEYDKTDIDLGGAATVDNVARLKLRGGYDLGRTLVYATVGAARADTSLGNDTGGFAGIGMAYQVTDQFTLGGEVLEHRFDDIGGSGIDADATTFNLRGSFRF